MSSPTAKAKRQTASPQAPDLASELRQGIADIESGNYIELTPAQLEQWAQTGELRVLDEWLAESLD